MNITKDSWCIVKKIKKDNKIIPDFEELWNLKPESREIIKIMGKEYPVPRWQTIYLKPYNFNGMKMKSQKEIPECLNKIYDFANSRCKNKFNQMLINWYKNGHDYIGFHSDDEKEIVEESDIFSLTLCDKSCKRIFRIKKEQQTVCDIELKNRVYIIMGGKFQKELKHGVPKISGKKGENCGRRVNITFRQLI